ncbi:MAG: protoporphyrinogen oxidase HemJ [Pseudomonadota bacterium]
MQDFLYDMYPWVKSLHIMAVISWMAALLYLPRLFVYHVETDPNHINLDETIVKWEMLLMKRIANPAMIVAWLCGIFLFALPGVIDWSSFWFYIKLGAVLGLTYYHHWMGRQRKALAAGDRPFTGRTYRMLNEVPAVLMIVIVIMVIVRPF